MNPSEIFVNLLKVCCLLLSPGLGRAPGSVGSVMTIDLSTNRCAHALEKPPTRIKNLKGLEVLAAGISEA